MLSLGLAQHLRKRPLSAWAALKERRQSPENRHLSIAQGEIELTWDGGKPQYKEKIQSHMYGVERPGLRARLASILST